MPLKTHRHQNNKKHPKHYAKVYWPYMPLLLIVGLTLVIGQSFVGRSQRDVLSYATDVSRQDLLTETNQQRAQEDLSTLSLNEKLNAAAQAKAQDMVARNYWSHTTPDDKAPWVFIDTVKYPYQKAGENLAFGFVTSQETVRGWMNSAPHRANILDSAYTEVGFGMADTTDYVGNGPQTVIVAFYARPTSAPRIAADETGTLTLSDEETPVNSTQPINEPSVKAVSKVQTLTNTSLPGITFVVGLLAGAAGIYLLLKHGLAVKRAMQSGERFVLKHPVLDLTIVSFIALCALLSQSVGVIR